MRQFGVGWFSDHTTCWFQMMSGFPANSVFIVDSEDRVRHHTVLDPRLELFCFGDCGDDYKSLINPRTSWNLEEVARLVAAYRLCFPLIFIVAKTLFCWCRDTDGGQSLAMAGWKGEEDTVDNQVSPLNIVTIVTSIYGRSLPSRASTQLCMGTRRSQGMATPLSAKPWRQKENQPAGSSQRFGFKNSSVIWIFCIKRVGFGGDQQSLGTLTNPRTDISNFSS